MKCPLDEIPRVGIDWGIAALEKGLLSRKGVSKMEGKALATTVLVSVLSLILLALVPWSRLFGAKKKDAATGDGTASADRSESPDAPNTMSRRREIGTAMPMSGYHQYLVGLARELNTADMDTIYDHHEVFCARCGVQFTREALAHLDLFGPGGDMFGTVMVVGATREGNDLRSGRCPKCGSMEMRVVTK